MFSNRSCFHLKISGSVDRTSGHRISGLLVHRKAFAGDRRFIHRSKAFCNFSIHRNRISIPNNQNISILHIVYGNFFFLSIP